MAIEGKKRITRDNINRVKESGVKPWRMVLSILFFVITIMMVPRIFQQGTGPLDAFAWFYLAMAATATVIDAIQGNVPLKMGVIINTFLGYMFRMFMEVALIILSIPVIILVFFLGPVMIFVFFISAVILVIFFIESILGIDINGVSAPMWGPAIWLFFTGLVVSFFAIRRLHKLDGLFDYLLDKIIDALLFFESLWRKSTQENKESQSS